ncbi:MAG TPA: histidine phosphatase family protein [Rhizomicrobium sp.]
MSLSLAAGLTLYFCRHGETQANVEHRFQGRSTDTPLTAKGCEQAHAMARILARHGGEPARFAYVCSPLQRAQTTMKIIRETLNMPEDGYSTDDRISEINLGNWDGLTDDEARALDPVLFDRRKADKWNIRVPGGENYADVAQRCESWIADLRADSFAVAHGALTRILRGLFQGLTWQEMSALDETQGVIFRVRGSCVERLEADSHA